MEEVRCDESLKKGPKCLLTVLLGNRRESEIGEGCREDANLRELLCEETLEVTVCRQQYVIYSICKHMAVITVLWTVH